MITNTAELPLPPSRRFRAFVTEAFIVGVCCLMLCLFSFNALALPPQGFVIEDLKTEMRDDALYVDLSLTVDNEDGLRDLLKDGAVLQLTVTVDLSRNRSWWANASIAEHVYASTIRHDPLTRDFLVDVLGSDGEQILRDRNLTRLLHASWRKLSLPVLSLHALQELDAENDYTISLLINLRHSEVPPWLENSLVFWSADVMPKEERSLPFKVSTQKLPSQ